MKYIKTVKDLIINDTVLIPNVKGLLKVEAIYELNEDKCVIKFYSTRYVEILDKTTEVIVLT